MLSFEQAPPISASFRFFLTAPWFGVAAGLLLAWNGPAALTSRWTPTALALTHLLTTGFMLQAMCGALLQFIPVATGANVWRPLLLASLVHPTIFVGAATLAFSLATVRLEFLPASELLLGAGLGAFCTVSSIGLFCTAAAGVSLMALRFAVAGLAVTTVLGLLLAQALSGHPMMAVPTLANLHAAWGLGGWALMLLAGVSFTVVPMFQMTPRYPPWLPRLLPVTLGIALGAATLAALALNQTWPWILAIALAVLCAIVFALVTLQLQHRRRRARTDATFAFFRGAMITLVAAGVCWFALISRPDLVEAPLLSPCIGILCLVGVFVSAINGMLYKIVPFIAWLKLSYRSSSPIATPSINVFIRERAMIKQMRLHFLAMALLLASLVFPRLVRPAGIVFAASCAWLGTNLLGACRVYVNLKNQNRADAADRGS
jgi:hypothetical protein